MADAITIKALQDASLDAKSLEEVVNGDEAKQVTTRKGETYPSVKKAIKTMFENGGFPAIPFNTKAQMMIDGASLADGYYAWVTDDTDANNGLYIKRTGAWFFSEFNVLKRVQDYVKKLDAKVVLDDVELLDLSEDKNGNTYRYTDKDGEMHLTGLNGSIQQNVNNLHEVSKNIPAFSNNNNQHEFTDAVGNVTAYFDSESALQLSNDVYVNGIKVGSGGSSSTVELDRLRYQSILTNKYPKVKNLTTISGFSEDNLTKRMPAGIVTPTGLVVFHHKQITGYDGDNEGSQLWKAIITIDDELVTTVVSRELFLAPSSPSGVIKHPMLGRTSDNRIILMFEGRTKTTEFYTRQQCFSSDEGVTFSAPTVVTASGTNPAGAGGAALGTTGTIVTAKNGRLIVPMYTLGGTCYVMYSDNDGESWNYSDHLLPTGVGQEPSVSLDLNDNLIMDIRPVDIGYRQKAISKDNGLTWELLETQKLKSTRNQGVIFRDKSIGAMIQTHNDNNIMGNYATRTHFTLSISYDNAITYPYKYMPFSEAWYGGYSQLLKWRDGIYILVIEYADTFPTQANVNENSGIIILSLNEVLSNVSHN